VTLCPDGSQGDYHYDVNAGRYVLNASPGPRCVIEQPSPGAQPGQEINVPLSGIRGGTWWAFVTTPKADFGIANTVVVR